MLGQKHHLADSPFAEVADSRDRRGVRHALPVVLACPTSAVLAGARWWVAVAEWTAEADRDALSWFGIGVGQVLPSESTMRRTMVGVDAADLDSRLGAWMSTRVGQVTGRRVLAIDGKSMRGGSRGADGAGMPHLLAALDHEHGVVLAQRAVPDKGSEIPALRELLTSIDLTDVVVTVDALHCQRLTAQTIIDEGGHYVLTVKGNQPNLRRQLKDLPWSKVTRHTYLQTGHGRTVRRAIKAIKVPAWVDWPGAKQVLQIRRTRNINGRRHVEVVYAIYSVPMEHAQPRIVAAWIQGHWGIENALHWVRDVTFDEDRHQLRAGAGPHVMASLRNTAISLLRLTGWTTIAAGLRHHARDSRRPIALLATP
ncbi:MAG: ISAs1 family transposase [Dermatophilaceae bacterium]